MPEKEGYSQSSQLFVHNNNPESEHVLLNFMPHISQQETSPQAIAELVQGFREGNQFQTLLGVTGSGKTFYNGKCDTSITEANACNCP